MARNGPSSGNDKASNRKIGRRDALKTIAAGTAGGIAGIAGISGSAAAIVPETGEQWTESNQFHAEEANYPTSYSTQTADVNSALNIAVEKTGQDLVDDNQGETHRIHTMDIEVLATSAYELMGGDKSAQQIEDLGVTIEGRDGALLKTWEGGGDLGFVMSGPARDASTINQSAEQIAEHSEFDDTIVALSEILVGRTNSVGSIFLDVASLVSAVGDNGEQGGGGTSYWWDYSVPQPTAPHLNPSQPKYDQIDQTYAATIYLQGIDVGIPLSKDRAELHIEPKIKGYGLNSSLPFSVSIGNQQGGGL